MAHVRSAPKTPMASDSSFLRLPVEIRLQIYQQLVPDPSMNMFLYHEYTRLPPDSFFRLDKEPCCPAILRVCRQIYYEAISLFYAVLPFDIEITGPSIEFLGKKYGGLGEPKILPSTFRHVRRLMVFNRLYWYGGNLRDWQQYACPTVLFDALASGSNSLCDVSFTSIHFMGPEVMYTKLLEAYLEGPRLFDTVVKYNFDPWRQLRGVQLRFSYVLPFNTRKNLRYIVDRSGHSKDVVFTTAEKMKRKMIKSLEELKTIVSQPRSMITDEEDDLSGK
ncbi:hypothetical protein BT63DRAFT_264420 [Microthyrium microscopicum]|uniref:2EXR domain-containing protein n=1 Tax=Microthyrium microscopicum TaxID=703497 RepID=A0A6A6UCI6_9PEZI|nr:hypothetical protein BT63DRAFT_264420 [Microthyrium microscopicum]